MAHLGFRSKKWSVSSICGLSWCQGNRALRFHGVTLGEMARNRSLKVFKFFAESDCDFGQAATVHPALARLVPPERKVRLREYPARSLKESS
jgi:hypothetical protein